MVSLINLTVRNYAEEIRVALGIKLFKRVTVTTLVYEDENKSNVCFTFSCEDDLFTTVSCSCEFDGRLFYAVPEVSNIVVEFLEKQMREKGYFA